MKYLLPLLLLSSCKMVNVHIGDCSCIVPKEHAGKRTPLEVAARQAAIKTNEYFKNKENLKKIKR